MNEQITRYSQIRRKPNPWVIALIVLLHVAIFYLLIRSFAPSAVSQVEQKVVSAFTVTVTTLEPEPEPDEPEPAGVQGDPGREAVPQPVTAPEPPIRRPEAPLHPARRRPAQRKHRELQTTGQALVAWVTATARGAVRAVTVRAAGSQPSQS